MQFSDGDILIQITIKTSAIEDYKKVFL